MVFQSRPMYPSDLPKDLLLRDSASSSTVAITVPYLTSVAANASSYGPAISDDGRYVAFSSEATNLVRGDTNFVDDVFVRDLLTNATTRVSVGNNGAQGNGNSTDPSISADGRYVAFVSDASNLVDGDTNCSSDVFVRDRQANTTTGVSIDSSGNQGQGRSYAPAISADGRYVAFVSDASNLVDDDTNGVSDVFVRDRQANTTTRVSLDSSGNQGNGRSVGRPSLSAHGQYVAFSSEASNFAPGDSNGVPDVFVRHVQTVTTWLVSADIRGTAGDGWLEWPSIRRRWAVRGVRELGEQLGRGG